MNLSFTPNEEGDILNSTIRDSYTGSILYIVETPKYAGGTLTTTITRRDQIDGSMRFACKILWKGSLEDVNIVLDNEISREVPVREILESAPGSTTYGSVHIEGVEYRWKSKGTGSKVALVRNHDNTTVAQPHSRTRSGFFRKPREMALEIALSVAYAVDIILVTFILVRRERESERTKSLGTFALLGSDAGF